MPFTLTGTGGLFTRWGAIGKRALNIFTQIGANFRAEVNTIQNQYEASQQDVIQDLYPALDTYQQTPNFITFAQTMMQTSIIAMGRDDAAPTNPADFNTNITRLITQMLSTAQTIAKPTVGASVGAGTNHGTGFLMGTTAQGALVDPNDGKAYDYNFVETLTLTCTSDALGSGATLNQEPWSVVGFPAVDNLNYAWPAGSGTSTTTQTVDPDSTANLLTNGNFNSWGTPVSNLPDSWTLTVATPGTTLQRQTNPLRSTNTYNLRLIGNGVELTCLRQQLTNLAPETTYAVNCWVKTDGAVAAGVLQLRLMDGSSTINDAGGTANTVTRNASAMTSSYVALNAFFRTPKILPSTIYFEIALTTALTNTEILDITDVVFIPADQAYTGGPFSKVIPGATAFAIGDTLTQATTNTGANTQFCRLLDRFFGLRSNSLRIPSIGGAAETIPDSLIA